MVDGRSIFISCGQFTAAEKTLGLRIAQMVKDLTNIEPFFAEEVQDLNGLHDNILNALHDCVAFIVVLHPRGTISRPDGSKLVRASVWIEQEIGIATYIQRVEKRVLPIIAFKHSSVGREGIRELLQLNPIEFTDDGEVLAALPKRLQSWSNLSSSEIKVELTSERSGPQDGHAIRKLSLMVSNNTNEQISNYEAELTVPAGLLKHWTASYLDEVQTSDRSVRCFRFRPDRGRPIPGPHQKVLVAATDYCTDCAFTQSGALAPVLLSDKVTAKLWIDKRQYSAEKTIQQLVENL